MAISQLSELQKDVTKKGVPKNCSYLRPPLNPPTLLFNTQQRCSVDLRRDHSDLPEQDLVTRTVANMCLKYEKLDSTTLIYPTVGTVGLCRVVQPTRHRQITVPAQKDELNGAISFEKSSWQIIKIGP